MLCFHLSLVLLIDRVDCLYLGDVCYFVQVFVVATVCVLVDGSIVESVFAVVIVLLLLLLLQLLL